MKKISFHVVLAGMFLYAVFASTSMFVAQGAILLGLLGWLCYCIAAGKWEWPSSPLGVPLLVFVFFSIVSSLLGLNVLRSLDSLRAYTFMLLIFLIPTMVPRRFLQPLMWCLVLLAGAGGSIYFAADHMLRGEV